MNPWELVLNVLIWAFALCALLGVLIMVAAILYGFYLGVKGWFNRSLNKQRLRELAITQAILRYKDQPNSNWRIDAYLHGVDWAWDRLHKKK